MYRPWYDARVLLALDWSKFTLMADSRLFCAAFMFGLTKYAFEVVIRRMPESRSSFRAAASSSRIKLEIKINGQVHSPFHLRCRIRPSPTKNDSDFDRISFNILSTCGQKVNIQALNFKWSNF